MPSLPSKRLYLRNLPRHVGQEDLLKHLSSYGKIVEVKFVHDYAFVQFESQEDARDVLETFQRQPFLGRSIVVEFAHPLRKDILSIQTKNKMQVDSKYLSSRLHCRYPVTVTNVPHEVCWQELKDFGRLSGGMVAYCDLDKRRKGRGFIEYFSRDEAERAIRELDGRYLGGKRVRVCGRPEVLQRDRGRSRSPQHRYEPRQRSPDFSRTCSTACTSGMSGSDEYQYRRSPPPAYRPEPLDSYRSAQRLSLSFASGDRNKSATDSYRPIPEFTGRFKEQYDYAHHLPATDAWSLYDHDRKTDAYGRSDQYSGRYGEQGRRDFGNFY